MRAAKAEGVRVTCEVSPQHLALTDEACASFDPVFKMNPPLRSEADVAAVTAGLADGTIDAIATDHAPHAPETKERPFEEAPPGMLGVETALAVAITKLVEPGVMPLADVLGALSWRPARIAGLDAAGHGLPIAAGNPANLCVLDPAEQWVVDPDRLASRSRNTPVRGLEAHRSGPPHRPARPTHRHRPRGAAMNVRAAVLVLRDGEMFEGEAIGALDDEVVATGEVVFNTALSGYQEIVTDPSYAGQVIAFTYPHIGNYGTNPDDDESRRPFCRGVIVRDLARRPSSWRSTESLADFLVRHGVPGITGIDTRRLTRHLRDSGAVPGAFGTDEAAVRAAADDRAGNGRTSTSSRPSPPMRPTPSGDPDAPFHVVAYDLGIKRTILRHLTGSGCFVEIVPASTPAEQVLERRPDGIFLSNGPGDPAAVGDTAEAVRGLVGTGVPRLRHLPRSPDPRARARRPDGEAARSAITARTIPSATCRRAGSRSRARTTTTRSIPTRSAVTSRSPTSTSTTVCARVCGSGASRCSRSSTTPRPVPVRTTRRTCSTSSPRSWPGVADVPRRTDLASILIIGSGPIVIGQACEFDYSGTQACRVLREEGYRVILVNSNPATIMTDPEFADATYVEPLDVDSLRRIIERERPDAVLPTLGGQTALNLAIELHDAGVLDEFDAELIGASVEAIHTAEDRSRFKAAMLEIGLGVLQSQIVNVDLGLPEELRCPRPPNARSSRARSSASR